VGGEPADFREVAGLCGRCTHALIRPTNKGTTYLRCDRAGSDPRFPRYPRLPMISCPGFIATRPDA
jgi:hypothetical protein